MVRTSPPVADRLRAWLDRLQGETGAMRGEADEACAALARMATTAPRGLQPAERDIVCRALNDAWAHVLAAVGRACVLSVAGADSQTVAANCVADRRAARLLDDVERRFADPRLTLTAVARQLAVSPSHLTHIVKGATGRTFGAHLHGRRVREARRLLGATNLSVKEVASHVGYATTTQLDRHFRKIVGCPPTVYRESVRRERGPQGAGAVDGCVRVARPTQSLTHPQK